MTDQKLDKGFVFSSYGVTLGVTTDTDAMLEKARKMVLSAFGRQTEIIEKYPTDADCVFGLAFSGGKYLFFREGHDVSRSDSEANFFKFVNSMMRVEAAERSENLLFIHAGAIGWKGEGIIFPAKSFDGKSTLIAELVKNGADYYSDEYAIIDGEGHLLPFPRDISLRADSPSRSLIVPENEGLNIGEEKIPVGMVVITSYQPGAEWKPEILSPGTGIMEIMPHTMTVRRDPFFSFKVLDLIAQRAIIIRSQRDDVKISVKLLLAFFDNHIKLAKIS